eukprot:g7254.t1
MTKYNVIEYPLLPPRSLNQPNNIIISRLNFPGNVPSDTSPTSANKNYKGQNKGSIAEIYAICHPNWDGVREATRNLGVATILTKDLGKKSFRVYITKLLNDNNNIKQIIIGGIPPGMIQFLKYMKRKFRNAISTYVIYHGSPSILINNPDEAYALSLLMKAAKNKLIKKIGFVKNTMVKSFNRAKIQSAWVSNFITSNRKLSIGPKLNIFSPQNTIHVGIFLGNKWYKNKINQVWAACTLSPNVIVHTFPFYDRESKSLKEIFKFCYNPIVYHGYLPNKLFVTTLSQMDINMHISMTDCEPITALESLSVGVPILLGNAGSSIFQEHPFLHRILVCQNEDDSDIIARCLKKLIEKKDDVILKISKIYPSAHNDRAKSLLLDFLDLKQIKKTIVPKTSNERNRYETKNLKRSKQLPLFDNWRTDYNNNVHKTVVLTTYELKGVTPGGVGVLIDSLASEMLQRGFRVIILYDSMSDYEVEKWAGGRKNLNVYSVTKMIFNSKNRNIRMQNTNNYQRGVSQRGETNKFVKKSIQWALAIIELYKVKPFEVLEFFEYAGIGATYLYWRGKGWLPKHIPNNIHINVRIHGSLELIDLASNQIISIDRIERNLLERYAMAAADTVAFPVIALKNFYKKAVKLNFDNYVLSPPPMKNALRHFKAEYAHFMPWKNKNILVLGKIQGIKGTEIIIKAVVYMFQQYPELKSLLFHIDFIGGEMRDSDNGLNMKKYVKALIPNSLAHYFRFFGHKDPRDLPQLITKSYRAAIIASKFESFCYSAHELHALGMPLIINDFVVFRTFFNEQNSYVWKLGNLTSLAYRLYEAIVDDFGIKRRYKSERITYNDAIRSYLGFTPKGIKLYLTYE